MVRSQGGLTIARLAETGGVNIETVRYYQRRGLIEVPDRPISGGRSGIRRYEGSDIRRLRFIRSAQAAGFTLEQIAELIALDATDDRPKAFALAHERIKALDVKIAELQEARDALSRLAQKCASGPSGPCPILSAFEHSG